MEPSKATPASDASVKTKAFADAKLRIDQAAIAPGPGSGSDDAGSEASVISPHYLELHPELANANTPMFTQETHPRDFKRLLLKGIEVAEAFPGAKETVKALNADFFIMPYGVSNVLSRDVVELASR